MTETRCHIDWARHKQILISVLPLTTKRVLIFCQLPNVDLMVRSCNIFSVSCLQFPKIKSLKRKRVSGQWKIMCSLKSGYSEEKDFVLWWHWVKREQDIDYDIWSCHSQTQYCDTTQLDLVAGWKLGAWELWCLLLGIAVCLGQGKTQKPSLECT